MDVRTSPRRDARWLIFANRTLRSAAFLGFAALVGCSSTDAHGSNAPGDGGPTGAEVVYATIMGKDEVSVIDGASREVTEHIPVGVSPAILLGTPDGSKLFSANWGDNTVSAIDVATRKVTSVPMDGRPWVIAMSPDGKSLYAGVGSNKIQVVNTASDVVVRSLEFDTLPASVMVSPDSKTLYVAHLTGNILEAVAADSGEVVHEGITVGTAPAWITMSPDGANVYALNFLSGDVTVVDTTSWTVTTTVAVGASSSGIVGNVTPDGEILCVTDYGTMDIAAIDTERNEVAWTLPTEGRPVGIGFSPDSARGYAGDYGPDSISVTPADLISALAAMTTLRPTGRSQIIVFDPKTGEKVGDPIPVGPGPSSIVVAPR